MAPLRVVAVLYGCRGALAAAPGWLWPLWPPPLWPLPLWLAPLRRPRGVARSL